MKYDDKTLIAAVRMNQVISMATWINPPQRHDGHNDQNDPIPDVVSFVPLWFK
jgi:hypothetical protein